MRKALTIAMQVVLGATAALLIGCSASSPTAADSTTINARISPAQMVPEDDVVIGVISDIDYDAHILNLDRTSRSVFVDKAAKIVLVSGDSRIGLDFEDLSVGMVATFKGLSEFKQILASTYVEVSDTFEKDDTSSR